MPRLISESVRQIVFRRVAEAHRKGEKLSVDKLYEDLRKTFGGRAHVGRTTVWKLRKKALDTVKRDVPPDPPWDPSPLVWSPEAYPFLLALNRYCVLGVRRVSNDVIPTTVSSQLTTREAKWGAKLYSALRDAPIELAYYVVSMFADRQEVAETYEQPVVLADIIGFLEYKPWDSSIANETYELACKLGRIPKMESRELISGLEKSKNLEEFLSLTTASLNALLADPERQSLHVLQNIVEQAGLVQQAAIDKIERKLKVKVQPRGSESNQKSEGENPCEAQ